MHPHRSVLIPLWCFFFKTSKKSTENKQKWSQTPPSCTFQHPGVWGLSLIHIFRVQPDLCLARRITIFCLIIPLLRIEDTERNRLPVGNVFHKRYRVSRQPFPTPAVSEQKRGRSPEGTLPIRSFERDVCLRALGKCGQYCRDPDYPPQLFPDPTAVSYTHLYWSMSKDVFPIFTNIEKNLIIH